MSAFYPVPASGVVSANQLYRPIGANNILLQGTAPNGSTTAAQKLHPAVLYQMQRRAAVAAAGHQILNVTSGQSSVGQQSSSPTSVNCKAMEVEDMRASPARFVGAAPAQSPTQANFIYPKSGTELRPRSAVTRQLFTHHVVPMGGAVQSLLAQPLRSASVPVTVAAAATTAATAAVAGSAAASPFKQNQKEAEFSEDDLSSDAEYESNSDDEKAASTRDLSSFTKADWIREYGEFWKTIKLEFEYGDLIGGDIKKAKKGQFLKTKVYDVGMDKFKIMCGKKGTVLGTSGTLSCYALCVSGLCKGKVWTGLCHASSVSVAKDVFKVLYAGMLQKGCEPKTIKFSLVGGHDRDDGNSGTHADAREFLKLRKKFPLVDAIPFASNHSDEGVNVVIDEKGQVWWSKRDIFKTNPMGVGKSL